MALTDEIVTGNSGFEPGITAILIDPSGKPAGLEYGPTIPGPDKKNPKTSL